MNKNPKHHLIVIAIISTSNGLLLGYKAKKKFRQHGCHNHWELPGFKVSPQHNPTTTLITKIHQHLGLNITTTTQSPLLNTYDAPTNTQFSIMPIHCYITHGSLNFSSGKYQTANFFTYPNIMKLAQNIYSTDINFLQTYLKSKQPILAI